MKVARTLFLILLSSGWSSPVISQRDQLLDNIEATIRLPEGALPLKSYVHYYAPARAGHIVGTFMLPGLDDPASGEGCEQLRQDMTSQPCVSAWPKSRKVGAGNRVWLSGIEKLPMPARDDGHCGIVFFGYRTSDGQFVDVACFDDQPVDY